jgi:hypothetical protein
VRKVGGVAQVVEKLPSMDKAPVSIPRINKKKKKKKRKKELEKVKSDRRL